MAESQGGNETGGMSRDGAVAGAGLRRSGAWPVLAARGLRDFGDSAAAVLLPIYLTTQGFDAFRIGIVATLALLGSAMTTLVVGLIGARVDTRRLLLASAGVMVLTGMIFAVSRSFVLVAFVAFFGSINPSAGSASIFAPLEQAALAGIVPASERTRLFARYALIGSMAVAAGALASGFPDLAPARGLPRGDAISGMFVFYGVLGVACAILYARLPVASGGPARTRTALGPSRPVVQKLAALFCIDSFAGGLAVQSLMALWLFRKFDLSLATTGAFFFWASTLTAFSLPVAGWLAARIGLVNTMVFTHIPASVFLMLAAVAPSAPLALGCLLARSALSNMDIPARNSFVMAVVTPEERTAAASFTAVPRSLASAISPTIAGAFFAAGLDAWPLILCGALKIVYDLALLWTFRDVTLPEEA